MFKKIIDSFKRDITKENTMKQNFMDVFGMSYIPVLVLVVYYLLPNGKQTMEQYIGYNLWLNITVILMFSFVFTPLFKGIQQYRDKKNAR